MHLRHPGCWVRHPNSPVHYPVAGSELVEIPSPAWNEFVFRCKVLDCKVMANSLTPFYRESHASAERQSYVARWLCSCSLFLLVLPLAGCNRDSYMRLFGYDRATLLKKYTPQDDEALAINYVGLLRQGQFEQIEDHSDPAMKNAETRDTLIAMSNAIPTGEPASIKTVDSRVVHSEDGSTSCITLEYEFRPQAITVGGKTELSGVWLIAQVLIPTKDGAKTLTGFHVSPSSRSFEEINEFTLADKGIPQALALSLAISVLGFTLHVFVLCIRTKMGKKRWVWLILIAIGVFRFTANWTTGEWFYTPLTFQVPPVTWICTPYGPWMIQITIPFGAIAFLLWRNRRPSAASPIQSPRLGPTLANDETRGT